MNSWMVDMADTFTRCFIREDRYKLLISGIGVTIILFEAHLQLHS